jgi:hypothetical protein
MKPNGENPLMSATRKLCHWGACFVVAFQLGGCTKETPEQRAYFNESLSCPPPAQSEFAGWGKSGSEHVCKIRHGPFVAFENGYVHIRGQYDQGKETGVWRWYSANGKVEKEINYSTSAQ